VSASASEILAGALKDYRRALIVGDDHTFGKGTVQSVFPLRPGQGAIKVTTALFYRPGGVSTQHDGVGTHVSVPSLFNHDGFGESTLPHSLQAVAIEPFKGRKANGTDGDRWTPLGDDVIQEVIARSEARVAADEFFQEVASELAEREQDDGVIVLSELLEEREQQKLENAEGNESEAGSDADEPGTPSAGANSGAATPGQDTASAGTTPKPETEEKEELSPQAKEALRILADLVLLTS
jgi:carboxyl-terminal processing protease